MLCHLSQTVILTVKQLEAYRETQAVKHWAGGFLDTDVDIGGNFYDLTAKQQGITYEEIQVWPRW